MLLTQVLVQCCRYLILYAYFYFCLHSMWDFNSLTRDGTCAPCSGSAEFNRWTTREIPACIFLDSCFCVFSSVAQLCLTLFDLMNRSMPGCSVHHQLPESTQTHAHQVGDAIQPFHPLLFPSPPTLNPSQHQGLSSESTLHMKLPKYWSFSFSISFCV